MTGITRIHAMCRKRESNLSAAQVLHSVGIYGAVSTPELENLCLEYTESCCDCLILVEVAVRSGLGPAHFLYSSMCSEIIIERIPEEVKGIVECCHFLQCLML